MGTTADYLVTLKEKLNADAAAKKAAYDAAYARATQASFDAQGRPTYSKNDQGQEKYGTLDLSYMNQERNIGVGAESAGTLKSGQTARQYATNLAGYKADVLAAQNAAAEGKANIDATTALEAAKYDAMYGSMGSGGGTLSTPSAVSQAPSTTTTAPPTLTNQVKPATPGTISPVTGGAAAGVKVSAPGVPVGANPYSYVPKTGAGAAPKQTTKTPAKVLPKVPPVRRTGPL